MLVRVRDRFRDLRSARKLQEHAILEHSLVWEPSIAAPFVSDATPCRMLDKTDQTGSPLQLVNGLILMSTFAGARLVYGPIMVRTHLQKGNDYLTHGRSPVVAVLPDALRGARWAFGGCFRRVRLRKHRPKRVKHILVRSI